jgi:hypothetical protein
MALFLRLFKGTCILTVGYLFVGLTQIIMDLGDKMGQLSKNFDSQTGSFDPAILLLEDQVETLCDNLEAILSEIWIPDTLKNLSRTKIDELRYALAQEDYDQIKTDLLILQPILDEIDGLYEALEPNDVKTE